MTQEEELRLTVAERLVDRGGVVRLRLVRADGGELPAHEAGAHVDLEVPGGGVDGVPAWRQYSLCGDPSDARAFHLGILLEQAGRGGSRAICDHLREGSIVRVGAPRNHFALAGDAERSVLLGGGIGITPLLAMAHSLKKAGRAFDLHYCTRSDAATPFLDVVTAFAPHLTLHHSDDGTRFRAEDLPRPHPRLHIYLCGPERFIQSLEAAARERGHAPQNVHREFFNAEVKLDGAGFEVEARRSGVSVRVQEGEPITKALARVGIKVEVKCEEGVCGTCITDVIAGDLDHRDHFLTDEEKDGNTLLALCCSRGRGKIVLDI
ncbi:MAG: PDR/VanB family oxidoreductase [Rhizobiaceae bacterium]